MRQRLSPFAVLVLLSATPFAQSALGGNGSVSAPSVKTTASVTPKLPRSAANLIVGMIPGGDLDEAVELLGAELVDSIPGLAPVGLLRVARPTDATLAALMSNPAIDFFEPVRSLRAPIEPGCSVSGPLTSPFSGSGCIAFYDGDPTPGEYYNQPALAAIDVSGLHAQLTGIVSTVAVIDTGVDFTHPALAGQLLSFGYDFVDRDSDPSEVQNGIDDDQDGRVDEAFGHGTHVAGTIALINPDARILPLRVLDSDGNGTSFAVAEAIFFAVASGADVINLSLGMSSGSAAVRAAIEFAHESEVAVFAAAGNTGLPQVQFPARMDDVMGVAAVDASDLKADFSAYGPQVELSAPGVAIYSAMPGNQYAWWSGTSMATAVATGAASLMHSLSGAPFDTEGDKLLEESSVEITALNPLYPDLLGDGRIDPVAAAALIDEPKD